METKDDKKKEDICPSCGGKLTKTMTGAGWERRIITKCSNPGCISNVFVAAPTRGWGG
jgi:hypothetical protein